MKQSRPSVQADQVVTDRAPCLMNLLDRIRERFVLADERRQLQTKEGDRLSVCAQQKPAGHRHGDHQEVESDMHEPGG